MENGEIPVQQEIVKPIDKIIEDRFSQTKTDRLVEHLTGFNFEDPRLMDKLVEDHNDFRSKYDLPDLRTKFTDPNQYELLLREIAQKNEIEIAPKSDHKEYFEKNKDAEAVYSRKEGKIFADINNENNHDHIRSLTVLEHELIHALQHRKYPEMKFEEREYEAFLALPSLSTLKDINYVRQLFKKYIETSIIIGYRQRNITPEWDNPEYFLTKVDGVSEEAIQKYKTEHQVDTEK